MRTVPQRISFEGGVGTARRERSRTLSEANLFIDDTAGYLRVGNESEGPPASRRAEKAGFDRRRLSSANVGRRRAEARSRQQEVSQISRELKWLAKELNVPLVALSQLSRAPEARNPPRPRFSPTFVNREASNRTPTWWPLSSARSTTTRPTKTRGARRFLIQAAKRADRDNQAGVP